MAKPIFKTFTLLLLVFSMAACGKSDEEKAQDDASNLVAEYNSLASYFRTAGVPSASWSDDRLNTYETNTNRVMAVQNALKAHNGSNGITISGRYFPDSTLLAMKSAVQFAKSEKLRQKVYAEKAEVKKAELEAIISTYKKTADAIENSQNPSMELSLSELVDILETQQAHLDSVKLLEAFVNSSENQKYLDADRLPKLEAGLQTDEVVTEASIELIEEVITRKSLNTYPAEAI